MPETVAARLRLDQGTLVCIFARPTEADELPKTELRLGGELVATRWAETDPSGELVVRFPLPMAAQRDGAMVLDISISDAGPHLARYTIFNGAPPAEDLATTVELLRADLQALKRAFMEEAQVAKLNSTERPLLIAEAVEQTLDAISAQAEVENDG